MQALILSMKSAYHDAVYEHRKKCGTGNIMNEKDAKNIFSAVDVLYAASSDLIVAIDGVGDNDERRALRLSLIHI